ncbi:6-phospho-beta-glucosidase [Arthrobacter sp. I2-34]|uniref:6-phospho-beta-glucosidase n=1 Tax=Arthrobacter hankyongi TaxID=2904801 RepID=A0ABS9L4V4_9MICC|nr:6-phospho-beta-glucosidase [Arthrobacter hankyongi]MCG2621698.1 6-phospho-beta-glucosidase [Arthrobacter hankyongi]
MKLSILGGGGFRVPLVYRVLAGTDGELVDEVMLQDSDAGRLDAIARVLADLPLPEHATPPKLTFARNLDDALAGAGVVFSAIRPGGTAGRTVDERVATRLNLLGQETTGAGGIAYALRSVPAALQIAHRMRELCPQAWLINLTNPAGLVTEAVRPILGDRVVGICDSPIGLVRRAARAAGVPMRAGSLPGVDYVGLNHLGWLRGLEYDGEDRLPGLLADEHRLASFEEGRVFGAPLLQTLGAIPNEYLFYYYFRREATLALSGAAQTRGEFIHGQQQELYAKLRSSAAPFRDWEAARQAREEGYLAEARVDGGARTLLDDAGGYEQVALDTMRALLTGVPAELILNVRNGDTFAQLPADAVIEVPAVVDSNGARPLPAKPLGLHEAGYMNQLKAVEREAIKAGQGDRDAALRAFMIHPLISSGHAAIRLLEAYEQAHGYQWA